MGNRRYQEDGIFPDVLDFLSVTGVWWVWQPNPQDFKLKSGLSLYCVVHMLRLGAPLEVMGSLQKLLSKHWWCIAVGAGG